MLKTVPFPYMTYGSESWVTTRKHKMKSDSMEMRFLKKGGGKTIMNEIKNEVYRTKLNVKLVIGMIEIKQT